MGKEKAGDSMGGKDRERGGKSFIRKNLKKSSDEIYSNSGRQGPSNPQAVRGRERE